MAAGMEEKLTMLRAAEMLPEVQRKLEAIKARRAERAAWLTACSPEELQEKVVLNLPLPGHLSSPPWRVEGPEGALANRILDHSWRIQAGTLPSVWEFPALHQAILSDSGQAVSVILRRCLAAVGVKSSVVCGVFRPVLEDGPGPAVPQVFLDIQGSTIDPSYSHQEESRTPVGNLELFVERFSPLRTPQAYLRELPSRSPVPLVGEEELEGAGREETLYLEVACSSELNQDKMVAMLIEKAALHPGALLLEKLMREFLRQEFRNGLAPLREEMQEKCWSCGGQGRTLSTCSGCKVARYCDKDCLQQDWTAMHKLMHKIIKKREKKNIF